MIIQIRGTSGSGKTWAMRSVIDSIKPLEQWSAFRVEDLLGDDPETTELREMFGGRRQPLFYEAVHRGVSVAICGHYESACGGCDNVGSAPRVFALCRYLTMRHSIQVVLSEGLLWSEDTKWSSQLDDLRVIYLSTKVDQCIRQINARRLAAGKTDPVNEDNTRNRVATINRSRVKLNKLGKTTAVVSSRQVEETVNNWLIEISK